jgi:hypothetical protein
MAKEISKEPERKYLTRKAASEYTGIEVDTLKFLERHGAGPACHRVSPRIVLYSRESIDRWVSESPAFGQRSQ